MTKLPLRRLALLLLAVAVANIAAHAQTFTVLYNFGTNTGDPLNPSYPGAIAQGRDGNLYSTTGVGGTGSGAVFKITPSGTLTVLYNFSPDPGYPEPNAAPIQGTDGNLYGTTVQGGTNGCGTLYKLTPSGTLTTLYQFDMTHGCQIYAPLVQGSDGNLYGTAYVGGSNGGGTVFKSTTGGRLTVLYNFDSTHGADVFNPVIQGNDGNFYGTTHDGGTNQ